MKKILLIILALTITLSALSGCGGKKEKKPTEAPTVAPTEAPTEAPTDPPTEAPTVAPTVDSASMDLTWFEDAVFLGDSITVALSYSAAADHDMLGDASFVCSQSLGYHNAMWDLDNANAVHPTYEGETILAETAAEVTNAKKIFIMLGVNDLPGYSPEETMSAAEQFCDRLVSCSPDVKIYFQSVTPMLRANESDNLNNSKISSFNNLLKAYCEENGYAFIDLFACLSDDSGALDPAYCSDAAQGIHFNSAGCQAWVDYLKTFVTDEQVLSANPDNSEPDEINFADSPTAPDATEPETAAETTAEE